MIKKDSRITKFEGFDISIIKQGDVEDIIEILDDPEVGKFLEFVPSPKEVYRAYFEQLSNEIKESFDNSRYPANIVFILRDKESNEYIGQCGLIATPFVDGVYEVGYQFKRKYWGRGYATIACQCLINIAFNYYDAHKLLLNCYGENIGSQRVAEKNHFIKQGVLNDFYRVEDGFDSKVIYDLDKKSIPNLSRLKEKYKFD